MRHQFTKTLLRATFLAALAGIGLLAAPGTARADYVTFTVNESVVPGATGAPTFPADLLAGNYVVNSLILSDGQAQGTCTTLAANCTWSENASATFNTYELGGVDYSGTSYLGSVQPLGYKIDGTLVSAGHYINTTCGGEACTVFFFDTQTGNLFLDPDGTGLNNIALLTATGVAPGTGGSFNYVTNHGEFNSNFLTATVDGNAIAQAYWPTLAHLQFSATINGDTNNVTSNPIRGEVSAQFTAVPEPATLSLLSLGLAAGARQIRRRRRVANA